jgi:Predicted flavin-nucleotide-binding protein
MFRELRRIRQKLSNDDAFKLLKNNNYGILSLNGLDGYPYGVPVNYLLKDQTLYFHGASSGLKYELINKDSKSSFCVVDESFVDGETYSNYYKSVICYGKVSIVVDETKRENILKEFCYQFNKDKEKNQEYIGKFIKSTTVYEFKIDEISGKVATKFISDKVK